MPNNLCSSLIVYGNFIPGGSKHAIFSDLPGVWQKGKIVAVQGKEADQICPGETDIIEAWMIEFDDSNTEMIDENLNISSGWEAQKQHLFERWTALDMAMGTKWVRDERRWWPEDAEPDVSSKSMLVINIYLPADQFPYLVGQDAVAPMDENNLEKLWQQVKSGEKEYDWSKFSFFLSDSHPSRFQHLFGDLPKGQEFIARLNRLYDAEHLAAKDAYTDQHLFAQTLRKTDKSVDEAIEMVRRHMEQQAILLHARNQSDDAKYLAKIPIEQGDGYHELETYCDSYGAWEDSFDILIGSKERKDHWLYCLEESCRGLTRHNYMGYWFIRDWLDIPIDLEPIYELFVAGFWFQIENNKCYVFKVA